MPSYAAPCSCSQDLSSLAITKWICSDMFCLGSVWTVFRASCQASFKKQLQRLPAPEIVETRSHNTKSNLTSSKHVSSFIRQVSRSRGPTMSQNRKRHHELRKVSAPSMLPGGSLHFSRSNRSSRSIVSTASSCLTAVELDASAGFYSILDWLRILEYSLNVSVFLLIIKL